MKLAKPYVLVGCERSITTVNFFTSLPLAKKLLVKKITIVGTIRANREDLPRLAKLPKKKQQFGLCKYFLISWT